MLSHCMFTVAVEFILTCYKIHVVSLVMSCLTLPTTLRASSRTSYSRMNMYSPGLMKSCILLSEHQVQHCILVRTYSPGLVKSCLLLSEEQLRVERRIPVRTSTHHQARWSPAYLLVLLSAAIRTRRIVPQRPSLARFAWHDYIIWDVLTIGLKVPHFSTTLRYNQDLPNYPTTAFTGTFCLARLHYLRCPHNRFKSSTFLSSIPRLFSMPVVTPDELFRRGLLLVGFNGARIENETINKPSTLLLPLWIKSNCICQDLARFTNYRYSRCTDYKRPKVCEFGFLSVGYPLLELLSHQISIGCHLQSLQEDSEKVLLVLL